MSNAEKLVLFTVLKRILENQYYILCETPICGDTRDRINSQNDDASKMLDSVLTHLAKESGL
jgi:hypothetical protein